MYDFWKCEFLPPSLAKCGAFVFGAAVNPEILALIDSLETDIDRQRNMAPELKVSMLAKLDRIRAMVRSADALDRLAENAQELGLGY